MQIGTVGHSHRVVGPPAQAAVARLESRNQMETVGHSHGVAEPQAQAAAARPKNQGQMGAVGHSRGVTEPPVQASGDQAGEPESDRNTRTQPQPWNRGG